MDLTPDQIIELVDQRINQRLNPTGQMCGEWMTVPEAHRALTQAGITIGESTLYRIDARQTRQLGRRRLVVIPTAWVNQRIAQHNNT